MDVQKLKAEHPDVYNKIVAIGVAQERERVDAHLTLGEASGAMELTLACIKDGSEPTASVNAKHFAAQMKKSEITARKEESVSAVETPKMDDNDLDFSKKLAANLGVEVK